MALFGMAAVLRAFGPGIGHVPEQAKAAAAGRPVRRRHGVAAPYRPFPGEPVGRHAGIPGADGERLVSGSPGRRYPLAPQMLPGAAAHYGSPDGYGYQGYGVPPGKIDWSATMTSGHVDAPVARAGHGQRFPVVLYSPPAGEPRTWETTLVQDLASRGYIVVTMDPTYEASEVEFPGGRVIDGELGQWFTQAQQDHDFPALAKKILSTRVADTRFVLGRLTALVGGADPGTGRQRLPEGLPGAMDLRRVGMFGVSAGGITTAEAMYSDARIKAGIDLDGNVDSPLLPPGDFLSPVWRQGLDQPLLFMGDPRTDHRSVPSLNAFWAHTPGWHLDLTLDGAKGENAYKDAVPLIPQIARELHLPRSFVTGDIGAIAPAQAVTFVSPPSP